MQGVSARLQSRWADCAQRGEGGGRGRGPGWRDAAASAAAAAAADEIRHVAKPAACSLSAGRQRSSSLFVFFWLLFWESSPIRRK